MGVCLTLDCINNSRGDLPRCTLSEIEIDDHCHCVNFQADNEYLKFRFRERRGYLRNLEKAQQWDKSQPPVAERAEALHIAARNFLIKEEAVPSE